MASTSQSKKEEQLSDQEVRTQVDMDAFALNEMEDTTDVLLNGPGCHGGGMRTRFRTLGSFAFGLAMPSSKHAGVHLMIWTLS